MKIKAILLDAKNREIKIVDVDNTREAIYPLLGPECSMMQIALNCGSNLILCDEEACFHPYDYGWVRSTDGFYVQGNALIVGSGDGDFTDTSMSIMELVQAITGFWDARESSE